MSQKRPEVVVVTGASAGRATAVAFARRGARVGLLARGHAGLEGARRDVEIAGGEALVLPTDVSQPDQVEAFGPIDVWVNCAMVSVFSPIKELTPDEFRRVTVVLPRDRGVIVQVGSALAYRSILLQSAYCAAKHAVVGFTDSLRSELAHDRSKVHVTGPEDPHRPHNLGDPGDEHCDHGAHGSCDHRGLLGLAGLAFLDVGLAAFKRG